MGHHFRALDGTVLDSVLDGSRAESALRDSLAMYQRVVDAARSVAGVDAAQPKADSLKPAAQLLGLQTEDPAAWPAAFITTLHGHVAHAAVRG
jgi:hypothetical protein